MIGRTLSHYEVLEELSRGGLDILYRALDLQRDREVAPKVHLAELVSDPERTGKTAIWTANGWRKRRANLP